MQTLFNLLLRLVLLLVGIVFALSLVFAAVLLLALWGLRALWARLTGRPVDPFVLRANPRAGFSYVFRSRAGQRPPEDAEPAASGWREAGSATRRGVPSRPAGLRVSDERLADIEDVEPKPPRD